jgi:riboflavin transporter FmnP
MKLDVNKVVRLAMLSALGVMLMLVVRFPIIPAATFLEYEPGDVPALIGAFVYGPVAGLIITLIISIIQALTVSAGSGWIGAIMHMVATGMMVLIAGFVYRKVHTFKGAFVALTLGSLAMIIVMIPLNLFFTTKFLNVPYEVVKAMIVPVIIPFNLIKAVINSTLTFVIYKPVSRILRVETDMTVKQPRQA